jgi:hypothetical protein
LRNASAEQTQSVLDQAARIGTVLLHGSPGERGELLRDLIEQVVITDLQISVALRKSALLAKTDAGSEPNPQGTILLAAPIAFRRRGIETKLVLPSALEQQKPGRADAALVKAVARGRLWFEQLAVGQAASLQAIADREGVSARYVSRLLPLAFLAPDIVELILEGRQPAALSVERLTNRLDLPLDWVDQRELLGA